MIFLPFFYVKYLDHNLLQTSFIFLIDLKKNSKNCIFMYYAMISYWEQKDYWKITNNKQMKKMSHAATSPSPCWSVNL